MYLPLVAERAAVVAQKIRSNNWPMVSFIHNGSKITTWMGYSFKQNQKHKIQSHILKIRPSFLNLKMQIIRLAQGTGVVHQLTKTVTFIATPMIKFI